MIAAAIDIGTNTTLALLAEGCGRTLRVLKDEITVNGLGDALRENGVLPPETIALNVDLLAELVRDFRRAGARAFAVAGTSALRRATNRADFVAAARAVAGVHVEILSGRDEAALTYLGALSSRETFPHERVAVLDLGGGSTEIVEGRGGVAGQGYSIDVGAVYLTNRFFASDPPTPAEIDTLREHLRERLPPLVAPLRGVKMPWILVGGTVVTLAVLKAGLSRYEPQAVGGTYLSRNDVERMIAGFVGKTALELQSLRGMPAGRGRLILAGAILLHELLTALELDEGLVSERGLRYGLWLAKFGDQNTT